MPFKKGNTIGVQFSSENQPATNGRTEGVRNRTTIARIVLDMARTLPPELIAIHPDLDGETTFEEVMTLVQAERAVNGDTNAYKALMDSAHGAPNQQTTLANPDGTGIVFFELPKKDE
jgi:hypothetical protein